MTEILLYGPIGDPVSGRTSTDIAREVSAADPAAPIVLRINSGGGDVMEGIAMLTSLGRHPAGFRAEIDGIAASMAAIIAMQANHRTMPADGWLMFHRISTIAGGTAPELIELAARMERMEENMVSFLARNLGKPTPEILTMLDEAIWLNGEDALAAGMVDALTPAAAIAADLGFAGSLDRRGAPVGALSFLDKTPDPSATCTQEHENSEIAFFHYGN